MDPTRLSNHFSLSEFCQLSKYPDNIPTMQAADIRPKDPAQFQRLVAFLKTCEYTDQLLTGNGWLHISWNPFGSPRHFVRLGYYK